MASGTVPAPASTALPVDGEEVLYEVIDGRRVELPPMSAYAGAIASRLVSKLNEFAGPRNLGEAVGEVLFHLPLPPDRNRRPDVAFVSYQRWARGRQIPPDDNAWDVVPDLAVEVVSPTDVADDILERIEEYFQASVRLVWLVYPRRRTIHVYESLTQIRVLTGADALDGGNVLAGFRLPLPDLF
jgi:Uma2 family endonuclease